MAGISLSGLASGIDTATLVDGLMSAAQAPRNQLAQQRSANQAAVTSISGVSTALAALQSAVEALDTVAEAASYEASSSSSDITAAASSTALPGQYSVVVEQLASEQRTYSAKFASQNTALNLSGTLTLQVGAGAVETVALSGTETLEQVASAISSLGIRVSASVVSDGSGAGYRLLVRGMDTGEDSAISFGGTGADQLSLNTTSYKSNSYGVGSSAVALGQAGSFTVAVGTGAAASVAVAATDSLDSIKAKIDALGITDLQTTVQTDGSQFWLQLLSNPTGTAAGDGLTFVESGTSLGLGTNIGRDELGYTAKVARDAVVRIDGFRATSSTNTITGALEGVSLTVSAVSEAPATVTVDTDADAISTKVSSVVSAYNAVIRAAHTAAGFGTTKAAVAALSGDSAIRRVTDMLRSAVAKRYQTGTYGSPAEVGITLSRDGTMSLDSSKLKAAINADPTSVQNLFADPSGSSAVGFMASLASAADSLTDSIDGVLTKRIDAFEDKIDLLEDRMEAMDRNLALYRANLLKQFTAMEQAYSASQTLLGRLKSIGA